MIVVENLHKTYKNLEVLRGINLEVKESEIVAIVGASGAGKTTLLHILGSLDKADNGKILINNINILTLTEKKLAVFRNQNIGFVFQFHHLLPEFTALENVSIPALIAKTSKKEALKKAETLLNFLNLSERLTHKPSELSGGEQQRVAVARALINSPKVILADEPSGNLDSENAKELHKLFFKLRSQFGQTFIITTHNKELATLADRVLTIKDGVIS